MKKSIVLVVALMLVVTGCDFLKELADVALTPSPTAVKEEPPPTSASPFKRPEVLCNYMHYFRGEKGDYGQWWYPGREPKTVVGPEPWRRQIWVGQAGDYPYIGVYDNAEDKEIIRWHIRLAKAAGITAFLLAINDWEKELPQTNRVLEVAAAENFKIAFMESHSLLGAASRSILDGQAQPLIPRQYIGYQQIMEKLNISPPEPQTRSIRPPSRSRAIPPDALNRAAERISKMMHAQKSHPAYYRVDHKPMLVIPYMDEELTPADFKNLLDFVQRQSDEPLYIVAIVPFVYWYFYPPAIMNTGINQAWAEAGVDSFTHWTPNGMVDASQPTRLKVTEFTVKDSLRWRKDPMIPVMPGFDDDAWRPGTDPAPTSPRKNGQPWRDQLKAAIQAKPRFLFIQAWNEWHEGAQIEPSTLDSDPYLYLRILADELGAQWRTPPLPPKSSVDPLRAPYLPYN